jgi:hypothetical protein
MNIYTIDFEQAQQSRTVDFHRQGSISSDVCCLCLLFITIMTIVTNLHE